MKRYTTLLLCLVCTPLALLAQSSVWKVSKDEHSLYIGGTCHILRTSDYPLPKEFDLAYAQADKLIFEINPLKMEDPSVGMKILQSSMYTDGTTLKSVLTAEAYKALADQGKKSNLPVEMLNSIKPGMAVTMISLQELTKLGVNQEGVDMHFARKAKADKKKIGELETVEFQTQMIAKMGEGYESKFVLYSLKDIAQIKEFFDKLIVAWRKGDVAVIEELFVDDMKALPKLYQDLLVKRNKAWVPQIKEMLASPEIEYVLVGVGHAVSDEGLLALLKKKGYTIEQIVAE